MRNTEKGMFRNVAEANAWREQVTDDLVNRTMDAVLWGQILTEAEVPSPAAPFDFLFFYAVATQSISTYFRHTLLYPLPHYTPACGFNFPNINDRRRRDSAFASSRLSQIFLKAIRRESVTDGDPFDAGYAFSVMDSAFNSYLPEWGTFGTFAYIKAGRGRTCVSERERLNAFGWNEEQWLDAIHHWQSRVLVPSGVIAESIDIPKSAPHLGYLKQRIILRLSPLPTEDELVKGDITPEEHIFIDFQDFFNMLLGDLSESGVSVVVPPPPHPYYEDRGEFIDGLVQDYLAGFLVKPDC